LEGESGAVPSEIMLVMYPEGFGGEDTELTDGSSSAPQEFIDGEEGQSTPNLWCDDRVRNV
jgi:hypothetical protein